MTDKQREDRDKELIKEVMDWHDSDMPKQEQVSVFFLRLSEKYKIVDRTIYQILEKHSKFILGNKDYETVKRILRIKREIARKEKSNKDVADLLDQLRKEFEDGAPIIDQSQHTHLYFIREALVKSDMISADGKFR